MKKNLSVLIFFALLSGALSCSKEVDVFEDKEIVYPWLVSFSLLQKNNPSLLIDDVESKIIGDSIVECWIPYILKNKELKPAVEVSGGAFLLMGIPIKKVVVLISQDL